MSESMTGLNGCFRAIHFMKERQECIISMDSLGASNTYNKCDILPKYILTVVRKGSTKFCLYHYVDYPEDTEECAMKMTVSTMVIIVDWDNVGCG
jgi:hypothetical protein